MSHVSLWVSVKKEKNLMYISGNKKPTVKVWDKTVDLKETKDLWALGGPCSFEQRQ